MMNDKPIVNGQDVLDRIKERQEPLKNLSAFYTEQRKEEERVQAERIAEMEKNMKPVEKSTDEKLLQAIEALTAQLKGKGE